MFPDKPRVVFDTNVMISNVLSPGSVPAQAILLAERLATILISEEVVAEYIAVLGRSKFASYIDPEDITEFVEDLTRDAEMVTAIVAVKACRDRNDDKFLALAVSGRASCVVTGDEDLLMLDPFQEVRIMTPRRFLDIYASDEMRRSD